MGLLPDAAWVPFTEETSFAETVGLERQLQLPWNTMSRTAVCRAVQNYRARYWGEW